MASRTRAAGPPSALIVEVPAAEPVVGQWRERWDPTAAQGVPAHVTVLYPWLPAAELDPATTRDLADVVRRVPAFDVTFAQLGRFPESLWLAPDPPDPFIALTSAVSARWPEYPPYEDRFDTVIPHLTIADRVDPDHLGDVVSSVAPRLPVQAQVAQVTLLVRTGERWERHSAYALG